MTAEFIYVAILKAILLGQFYLSRKESILYSLLQTGKKFAGLSLLFCATTLNATSGSPYLGVSAGASWGQIGNNYPNITYYGGLLNDAYPLHSRQDTTAILGINGGYEWTGQGLMPAIAFGLGIFGTPVDYTFDGQVIETALSDPSALLYNYTYHINSVRLMPEAQFTWAYGNFLPFLHVGLGAAWNSVTGYSEAAATSNGYVALPAFQSKTQTDFAYDLGLGIGYAFNALQANSIYPQDKVSLGYRYLHLGNTSFGTRGPAYPYSLDTGLLTANELYVSYTHLF